MVRTIKDTYSAVESKSRSQKVSYSHVNKPAKEPIIRNTSELIVFWAARMRQAIIERIKRC